MMLFETGNASAACTEMGDAQYLTLTAPVPDRGLVRNRRRGNDVPWFQFVPKKLEAQTGNSSLHPHSLLGNGTEGPHSLSWQWSNLEAAT
jgi:hypothetical protein